MCLLSTIVAGTEVAVDPNLADLAFSQINGAGIDDAIGMRHFASSENASRLSCVAMEKTGRSVVRLSKKPLLIR